MINETTNWVIALLIIINKDGSEKPFQPKIVNSSTRTLAYNTINFPFFKEEEIMHKIKVAKVSLC